MLTVASLDDRMHPKSSSPEELFKVHGFGLEIEIAAYFARWVKQQIGAWRVNRKQEYNIYIFFFFHGGALATKIAFVYLKTQNRMSLSQECVLHTATLLRSWLLGTLFIILLPL